MVGYRIFGNPSVETKFAPITSLDYLCNAPEAYVGYMGFFFFSPCDVALC